MLRPRFWRREDGSVIVQFALVFPLFFLMVLWLVDFSRAYMQHNAVLAGLREGARYASSLRRPDTAQRSVKLKVSQFSRIMGSPIDTSKVTFNPAASDDSLLVSSSVAYRFPFTTVNDTLKVWIRWERAATMPPIP
jgi:Flp pilus assembly protein TadG